MCSVGNHKLTEDELVSSLNVPGGIFYQFMLDNDLEMFCEIIVVVHAGIVLVIPVNVSEVAFLTKSAPGHPPV